MLQVLSTSELREASRSNEAGFFWWRRINMKSCTCYQCCYKSSSTRSSSVISCRWSDTTTGAKSLLFWYKYCVVHQAGVHHCLQRRWMSPSPPPAQASLLFSTCTYSWLPSLLALAWSQGLFKEQVLLYWLNLPLVLLRLLFLSTPHCLRDPKKEKKALRGLV